MDKRLKTVRKILNKQFPGIRNRRFRREVINEIVRIFQTVESLIKIQMRSGNERKHFTSHCKIKIMIVRPNNKFFKVIFKHSSKHQFVMLHCCICLSVLGLYTTSLFLWLYLQRKVKLSVIQFTYCVFAI